MWGALYGEIVPQPLPSASLWALPCRPDVTQTVSRFIPGEVVPYAAAVSVGSREPRMLLCYQFGLEPTQA